MHNTPIRITPLVDQPAIAPTTVDLRAQAYPHADGGFCDDGLCIVIGADGHRSWATLDAYVDSHNADGSIRPPGFVWLDTGEDLPGLATELGLLAEDRPTALRNARALSFGVVSDVRTGRVA